MKQTPKLDEFNLIEHYFKAKSYRGDVIVGVGDDGAVTEVPADHQLVTVTDTMVEGVHFDKTTPPRAIGHKLVAVNLSDLAAMGAAPSWGSLALTLPTIDEDWLHDFSGGLKEISNYYECDLIGGDTTRGPLTLTYTAQGVVPNGTAIRRDQAKAGDWLYVSGSLGDAGLALRLLQGELSATHGHLQSLVNRLHYPTPRVALGQLLRGVANSCIDVSDGLLADLNHLLPKKGQMGVQLELDKLPLSLALTETLDLDEAFALALTAGDDYELLFTVPEQNRGRLETITSHLKDKPVCIGRIVKDEQRQVKMTYQGEHWQMPDIKLGYNHFGAP
ncbi:thiamine-phosphate kinase [Idiomarina fontislapidosi]|uniref:Thiamine-monophosphate kinase n=1 Tax=Idiomarina fontislapidosi TaxID=263723 RepID=A0A432Y8E0_9GAMM|nr:thiamine-phosphate kinase [Idiomarina fontislapidosi]PYE33858.1 thiamine-phosphate kinase [Idiomarina fontislapidosi]RUO57248.1 thiamine-phosphate kinase [Idiomarina fontislapidosi]|tara:strand:- start:6935 stop:7930 length:996 start_codon:yes stop_codon:yes gene_type:complete